MDVAPARTRYCSRCLTTFPGDADRCPNLSCRALRPQTGWGELLDTGALIDRTYRVRERLAIGGAGATYLGRELGPDDTEEGPLLAIKVLYAQRDSGAYLRRLQTEAQILQGLNHPQIVECRGFVHRAGHSPYLVTRFMEGGSLLDHLRRVGALPPHVVAGIARQICWALDVAHRQGVIHRDLKPENVLLDKVVSRDTIPDVRVADFGIAKVFGGVGDRLTRVGAFVGTPQYAAPEQFEGTAPEPATDVYALGAVMLFCLTLRPAAEHIAELDPEDQRDHLVRNLPPKLPELPEPTRGAFERVLAMAMAVDAGDRCDVAQLETALAQLGTGGSHAALEQKAPPPLASRTLTVAPPPTPKASALPAPTITRTVTEGRGGVMIGGAFLAMAGAAILLVALGVGAWWWSTQPTGPAPILLSPTAESETARNAFTTVGLVLSREGVKAERTCGAPKYLGLQVDLDTLGGVTDVQLTNYAEEKTRACVEAELAKFSYPHGAGGPARIALQLRD